MNDENLTNVVVGAITAIATLASQYGIKKLKHKQSNLELEKEQQEHTNSLYSKVIELQRDSISYVEEANKKINALLVENDSLRDKIIELENKLDSLK